MGRSFIIGGSSILEKGLFDARFFTFSIHLIISSYLWNLLYEKDLFIVYEVIHDLLF